MGVTLSVILEQRVFCEFESRLGLMIENGETIELNFSANFSANFIFSGHYGDA